MMTIEPPSTFPISAADALSKSGMTRFVNRARAAIGLTGEVEVLLTSDAELKRLNRTFRGKNKPTDVLSFPTPPEIFGHHAGDLAISLDTAARQASQFGHTLRDEVRILLLHGLLHLSGLDHETDQGEMAAREAELRATLKLPVSLIARAEAVQNKKNRHSERSEESPHSARSAAKPTQRRSKLPPVIRKGAAK
jgi:probable rRNA maturation factor